MADYVDLDPTEAAAALREDSELIVLDVRTLPEHQMHRIDGAVLVPVQELPQRVQELDPQKRYVVTCEHGVRSRMACAFLDQAGFSDLRNVVGGMARWVSEGLPIVRG